MAGFVYRANGKVVRSPVELSDSDLEEAFGGPAPPPPGNERPLYRGTIATGDERWMMSTPVPKDVAAEYESGRRPTDLPKIQDPLVQGPAPFTPPGFGETLQRGAKQIVQHAAGNEDYPTTGSGFLDTLVSPVRMVMGGLERGIEARKGTPGMIDESGRTPHTDPTAVTEAMTGAAMLGGLGRSPRAFKAGRYAKPTPAEPFKSRMYREPAGPPEFVGPPEPPPLEPATPGPSSRWPQRALPPGSAPSEPKLLPGPGQTTVAEGTGRAKRPPQPLANAEPMPRPPVGSRYFVAGEAPGELSETIPPVPREAPPTQRPPKYPSPREQTTLEAAKGFETGTQGPQLSPREMGLVARARGNVPEAPVMPPGPYDFGLPEGMGRDPSYVTKKGKGVERPGTVYGVREKSLIPATEPPVVYKGTQRTRTGAFKLYELTEDVPGLGPKGDTLSEDAIRQFFGREPAPNWREVTPPPLADTRTIVGLRGRAAPAPPPNAAGLVEDVRGQNIPPGKTPYDVNADIRALNAGERPPSLGSGGGTAEPPPPRVVPGEVVEPPEPGRPPLTLEELRAQASAGADRAIPPERQSTSARSIAPDVTESMQRSASPEMQQLGERARDTTLDRRGWINQQYEQAAPALADIRTPIDRAMVSTMLDSPVSQELLEQVAAERPEVARAYAVLRDRFDAMADARGIPRSDRKADYFPHLFPKEVLQSGRMDFNVRAIRARMDQVPASIRPFFEYQRTGAPGWRLDPHYAFDVYTRQMGDKLFVEPFLREANELVPRIGDLRLQRMARGYLEEYARQPYRDYIEQGVMPAIQKGEFYAKLAGNPKWNAVNWVSGRLATFSHFLEGSNPTEALRTMRVGSQIGQTPAGDAWFSRSGHTGSTFLQEHVGSNQPIGKIKDTATLWTNRIEVSNRKQIYFGEMWRQMGKPPLETFEAALESGTVPREAVSAANRAVGQTQGLYGHEFDPKWLRQPYLRPFTQFMSTPAKVLYGLAGKPQKLLTYAILGEGIEEVSRFLNGPDMRGSLGVGINVQGLVRDLADGVPIMHAVEKNTLGEYAKGRGGMVSFSLGPIVETGKTVGTLAGLGWTAAKGESRPGDLRRAAEAAVRESTVVNRGYQAVQDRQMGGSLWDAGRQLAGMPSEATQARSAILQEMRAGQRQKAMDLINMYNMAHPDAPLQYDGTTLQEGRIESVQRKREKRQNDAQIPPMTRKREAQPPRVQDALQ